MNKGKAYANRKPIDQRPEGDLYVSPKSIVWELLKKEELNNPVWECACGTGAISDVLAEKGINYKATDLTTGTDFLKQMQKWDGDIFTNPPFSLWDDFVMKAKELSENRVIMLGRTNYFGTVSRYNSGIWENLKKVYVFNRYVDYQTPPRDDGLFHVGALCTGWFIWEKGYTGEPVLDLLDVQKYAKLGQFKK